MAQTAGRTRRRWVVIAGIAILAVLLLLGFVSSFYVDVLWFREVHQSGVYWGILWTKLALGVIFGLIFFILLVVNLFVARRLRPRFRVFSPEQEVMERYRVLVEPYANQLIPAVSARQRSSAASARVWSMWRGFSDICRASPASARSSA